MFSLHCLAENETKVLQVLVVMVNSLQYRGHEVLVIECLHSQQAEGMMGTNLLEGPQSMTQILPSHHFCECLLVEMTRMTRQHHFQIPEKAKPLLLVKITITVIFISVFSLIISTFIDSF